MTVREFCAADNQPIIWARLFTAEYYKRLQNHLQKMWLQFKESGKEDAGCNSS